MTSSSTPSSSRSSAPMRPCPEPRSRPDRKARLTWFPRSSRPRDNSLSQHNPFFPPRCQPIRVRRWWRVRSSRRIMRIGRKRPTSLLTPRPTFSTAKRLRRRGRWPMSQRDLLSQALWTMRSPPARWYWRAGPRLSGTGRAFGR